MKEIEYDGSVFKDEDIERKKVRSKGSAEAPTIRTFPTDVQKLVQEQSTTKTQIVMAEAERREKRGQSRILHEKDDSHLGRIILLLTLTLAFALGIGAYVLIGAKTSLPVVSQKPIVEERPVTAEAANILITDSPREQILADISIAFGKTSLPKGEAREISFKIKDENGNTRPATTGELLTAFSLRTPPNELLRSLSETLLFEIYSGEKLTSYIQISSRSYPNTFAGMLSWEPNMSQDLTPVLNPWYNRKDIGGLFDHPFEDERIGTIDARVLRDAEGGTVLAYAFVNKKILLITNSTDTLLALATKLAD